MVPPASHGVVDRSTREIPRVLFNFAYEIFTLCDWQFHTILLLNKIPHWAPTTPSQSRRIEMVWANPLSLSATDGISFDLYSSPYLDVSVRVVSFRILINYPKVICWDTNTLRWIRVGFPIRTPPDRRIVTPPRRLSQPCASFFGNLYQGIHCLR